MNVATRYFLLDEPCDPHRRLLRLGPEEGLAYRWKEGRWVEDPRAYGLVTGLAGDSNFEEATEEQAARFMAGVSGS